MPEIKTDEIYTPTDIEKLLKISHSTVKRLIKDGRLKASKVGGRYRIIGQEVLRLISPENSLESTPPDDVPKNLRIAGERIFLRTLDPDLHATQRYCDWINDPEVNRYLETRGTTKSKLKQYIIQKNLTPDCVFLGIFDKSNDKHIGNIKLSEVSRQTGEGIVGIIIGDKEYWGKGYGNEAINLLVRHAFSDLRLEKIRLAVLAEHSAAVKLYLKCGFVIDQTISDYPHDGQPHKCYRMSLNKDRWLEMNA